MEIFQADINDIPGILEVADATWKQTYAGIISPEQINYMYSTMYTYDRQKEQMQHGMIFLICREGDKTLGFTAYKYISEESANPDGRSIQVIYVPKLYIKPEAQRKGIGKKFLSEIERIGGENNCHFVELNVNRNNPALHFYERLGFFVYKSVDIPIGKFFMNDYVMRKSIQFVAP